MKQQPPRRSTHNDAPTPEQPGQGTPFDGLVGGVAESVAALSPGRRAHRAYVLKIGALHDTQPDLGDTQPIVPIEEYVAPLLGETALGIKQAGRHIARR